MDYEKILDFLFCELTPKQWWKKDPELDNLIKNRFDSLYAQASLGELYAWRDHSLGRLAEVIILDPPGDPNVINNLFSFSTIVGVIELSILF